MAEAQFIFQGKIYKNAETAFQYKKALACGKKEARQIQRITDPYEAKRACKNVKETEDWKQKK